MTRALEDFLVVGVVEDGAVLAEGIFQRKYRVKAPDFPHHVLAFYRREDGALLPACYIHFTDAGKILLGGGACSDDRVLRNMSVSERAALRAAGGLYKYTLAYALRHFAPHYTAIFGYCGDVRAERIDLAVGFVKTEHPHLLVYWASELSKTQRAALIAKAHAVGPF
jgi:hypothetical protein